MSETVKGNVVDPDSKVLANCQLFMYRRTDGALLGSAVSDQNGAYELTHTAQDGEEVFVVCLDNDDLPDFEGLVQDRIVIAGIAEAVISCDGAAAQFKMHSDFNSRNIEVSINGSDWANIDSYSELNFYGQHASAGVALVVDMNTDEDLRIKLRSDSEICLYVDPTNDIDEVNQKNKAYVLYDADGNVIDTTLESSHDYSGSYIDNTSTDKDYVVMFRAADFCLSKTVILEPTSYILISPDLQYEVGSLTDAVNNTKITWRMKVDGVDIGISASEDTTFLEDFANVLINYGLVVEFGDAGLYIYTNADITRNIELIPDMEYVVKINLYGNPTAKILDDGTIQCKLSGYLSPENVRTGNINGISFDGATNQVLMMVDAGLNVPELYIELTVNEQVFRIDMVEDEVFHDTVYNYIEQNLSQYFTVRPYEAHSPAIGYDPAYFFVLENISNQPLRVQVKALSSAATLDGSEYANVSLVSNSDDGYNPTVESVEMPSTTVQFGSTYTACMNPLSVVKINSTLDNTLKVDLTTGMLTISGIKQIQFANGDLFNVGNVYVNVAEKHTGVAICIIDPDYGENDTVSFGGQALVQVITYPTRSLASIDHIGDKYIEMGKVVKSYPTDHLVHVPTQCPNVKTLNGMFSTCSIFNDPNISNWDVSNITGLNSTFREAYAFNQPLNWNVSKVDEFIGTFASSGFNNDSIKSWDVSNGYMFNGMFANNRVFNQDISGWNMKNAHNLTEMFFGARAFNQDLSQWCMTNVTTLHNNFNGDLCPLTVQHYPVWGTCPRGESNV